MLDRGNFIIWNKVTKNTENKVAKYKYLVFLTDWNKTETKPIIKNIIVIFRTESKLEPKNETLKFVEKKELNIYRTGIRKMEILKFAKAYWQMVK